MQSDQADMTMIMPKFKHKMVAEQIENLNDQNCDDCSVTINRNKALLFEESGQIDHEGCKTIFGQVF